MSSDKKKQLLDQLRALAEQQLSERTQKRDLAVEKMQGLGTRDDAETQGCFIRVSDTIRE